MVKLEAVFLVRETMTFVVLHHIVDLDATVAQCLDHLVRLGLIDTRIVGSLRDKQRTHNLVGIQGWRISSPGLNCADTLNA